MAEFGERQGATDRVRQQYRQVNGQVPLGELSLETYHTWHLEQADAASLDAQANYEIGWIELERMIAMRRRALAPSKEIGAAAETAREHFFAAAKNPDADPELRARARVAAGSVGAYLEMALGARTSGSGANHLSLLSGIQRAGSDLLQNPDTASFDYMQTLVAMGLLNEFSAREGWFLPPAPRQDGDIVAYTPQGDAYPIILGEHVMPDVVVLSPQLLDDDSWGTMSAPLATLRAYIQLPAGSVAGNQKSRHRAESNQQKFIKSNLKRIAIRLTDVFCLGRDGIKYVHDQVLRPADSQDSSVRSLAPESKWFVQQPLTESIPHTQLEQYIRSLQALSEKDGLGGEDQHILGWMQLEYGQLLVEQAGDYIDAPAARAASEQFDAAMQSFVRAAEIFLAQKKYGDAASLLLDIEAAPVYKALCMQHVDWQGGPQEHLQQTVENYVRQLAGLALKLRDTEHHLTADDEQMGAFYEAVLRLTTCLLVTATTDEANRHLVVSTSVRGGGNQDDTADVTAFPLVYEQGYDKNNPINIKLGTVNDIIVYPQQVAIGLRHILPKPNQPLYMLRKLAATVRSNGKETRGDKLDALAQRIADSIIDAYES